MSSFMISDIFQAVRYRMYELSSIDMLPSSSISGSTHFAHDFAPLSHFAPFEDPEKRSGSQAYLYYY